MPEQGGPYTRQRPHSQVRFVEQVIVSTECTRAWAHDGAHQIEYARAGAGRTVLLLADSAEPGQRLPPLFCELARRHRVIQPMTVQAQGELTDWLHGFLDALGFRRVSLVATPQQALAALQFAMAEPDRIDRLVLLTEGAPAERLVALSDRLAERQQALLVLAADSTGHQDALTEFLE